MSKPLTPMNPSLFHDEKKVAANQKLFRSLCEIFAEVARPYMKAKITQEAEAFRNDPAAIQQSHDDMKALAEEMLAHKDELQLEDTDQAGLQGFLQNGEAFVPTDADVDAAVEEETGIFTQVAMTSWLMLAGAALRTQESISVNDALQPDQASVPPAAWQAAQLNMSVSSVDYETEFPTLMRVFAQKLTKTADTVELPFDMKLEKTKTGYSIRRSGAAPAP